MINLIYGEDIAKSRNYFLSEKQKKQSSVSLDGAIVSVSDLTQALQGSGLFSDTVTVFIENLLSKRKKGKERTELMNLLSQKSANVDVFLWESKDASSSDIKALGKPLLNKFEFPKEIFIFLDNLLPRNSKKAIELFHKTLLREEPEFIFFMIVRHIRILLALLDTNANNQIDEMARMSPWQKTKLEKQLSHFDEDSLINFYDKLFSIEQQMKTGKLTLSLSQNVDFLLSTL